MPVAAATYGLTNFNTAAGASQYKAQIDADFSVLTRLADIFAPHQGSTADMRVYLDPGFILSGTSLTELGTYTTATFSSASTSATVASATGISGTMWITGAGIPNGTTCTISGTTLTLSQATTAAGTAAPVVLGQRTSAIVAPVTNPRIDRVVVSGSTGAVSIIAGAEAATPSAPALTAGVLPVAQVLLQTSSTSILNTMITDERAIGSGSGVNNTEATVASAGTTDIGATNVNTVLITGVTTITSFGSNGNTTNPIYRVRWNNALTLTNNNTSLILPGANNIVTIAGDSAVFQYLGSGNWKCLEYTRFSGANITTGLAATIASATTTDLGTKGVNILTISGTTTITGFGSTATLDNPLYFITFSGALTLTYNATSLIVPGVANITTAANDTCIAQYLGSGNWQVLNYCKATGNSVAGSGNGGATVTSTGSAIVLTSSSNRMQDITFTAADLYVQLPAANTLTTAGGPVFMLSNKGAYPYFVTDAGGNTVTVIQPNATCAIYCSSISTSNGTWVPAIMPTAQQTALSHAQITAETTGASQAGSSICMLTATTALLIYSDVTNAVLKAVVISISNGVTLTAGTPVTVISEASNGSNVVCALTSTLAVVSWYRSAATTACKACSLSISGTTITVNTPSTISSTSSPQPHAIFPISSTSCVLFYGQSTTSLFAVVLSSISTTITVNTAAAQTVVGMSVGIASFAQMTTTSYLVGYTGTSSFLGIVNMTISGTTVTWNTPITNQSNSAVMTVSLLVPLSSTKALLMYNYTQIAVVSLSGTTPSVGIQTAIQNFFFTTGGGISAFVINNTVYCMVGYGSLIPGNYVTTLKVWKCDTNLNYAQEVITSLYYVASANGATGSYQSNTALNNQFAVMNSTATGAKGILTTTGGSSGTNINTVAIDFAII